MKAIYYTKILSTDATTNATIEAVNHEAESCFGINLDNEWLQNSFYDKNINCVILLIGSREGD